MAKTQIFIHEFGDDKRDGMTVETAVKTAERAQEIADSMENPTCLSIGGSEPFVRRMKAALGIALVKVRTSRP